ncbi:MAG: TIGR00730 family Rossman fold protein [Actinomycetota bacterium]|nr:TIGR00730 family Rossman fold protein [Actinomycetota bacterium]
MSQLADEPRLRVVVFCASAEGDDSSLMALAREVGVEIAERGAGLVYGGGRVGLMGAVADGALSVGGEVIGVIPQQLVDREVAHLGLSELVVTESMHERKAAMAELADGFIALPGGFGTLEEVVEILTWNQLGIIQMPVVFCDVSMGDSSFWAPFIGFCDHAVAAGVLRERHRKMMQWTDRAATAVDIALSAAPDVAPKWKDFPPRP